MVQRLRLLVMPALISPFLAQTLQDVNKEPGAEEKFKKIGEAYEVGK
jgi:hypothetical protein